VIQHDPKQTHKHFYKYSEKEADFKRLNKLFGITALLLMPLFITFLYFSKLPVVYAMVTGFSSFYILMVIILTKIVKKLRPHIFIFYFILFLLVTIFTFIDLVLSEFEQNHMVGFVVLFSVILTSLQRFVYALIFNSVIFSILIITYLIYQKNSDEYLIIGSLIFISGAISLLILNSRNKMIQRIQDYSTYLSTIINQPGIGFAMVSIDYPKEILDYNNCFLRLAGFNEDVEKTVINNWLNLTLESNRGKIRFDVLVDNTDRWIEVRLDEIVLNEGCFYLVKLLDITDKKNQSVEIKKNETKFRLLFEENNDALVLMNKGVVQQTNQNTQHLLGLSEEQILNNSLWKFSSPYLDNYLLKERIINLNENENRVKIEWDFVHSSGEIIQVEITIVLIYIFGERTEQCVIRDITEQKKYETNLRSTQQTFKNIIENIPEAILLFANNKILFANTEAYRMLNFDEKSISSVQLDDLFINEHKEIFIKAINTHHIDKKRVNEQVEIKRLNSDEHIEVEFTLTNTLYNGERVSMIIMKDISLINKLAVQRIRTEEVERTNQRLMYEIHERKKTEKLLEEQSLKLKAIIENSSNTLIWTVDRSLKIKIFNEYFRNIVKQLFDQEITKGFRIMRFLLAYTDKQEQLKIINQIKSVWKGTSTQIENKVIIDDKVYWFETFLNPIIDTEGNVVEISFVSHNTTDKKENEQEIISSLKEKEVLLKEVHHRVKNNLQVISSILSLQASYVTDENTINILQESQNRIKSMSFIHENLYQRDRFSSIDFSEYIFNLSNNLIHSYRIFDNLVELKFNMEQIHLSLDQAIPCGLIVNELVSNALKYAFSEHNKNGEISIELSIKENRIILMIGDNGVGLPQDFDVEKTETLGLQLVLTLIDQLDAIIEIKRQDGTKYFITFDVLKA